MKGAVTAAAVLLAIFSPLAPALVLKRKDSSGSWSGTNLYFLQGLSDDVQDAYIQQLADSNAKVVRLWVNRHSQGCQKGSKIVRDIPPLEETIGEYNSATLDELDKVLVKLVAKGIKAIISPHDGNSLLGDYRKDAYFDRFHGGNSFYESDEAFKAYDARTFHILNYQGLASGKVWKDWPEAIMSFNLQNEPMVTSDSNCKGGDPKQWACGRATHMREVLGSDSPILVSTGGMGGDFAHDCNFSPAVTSCDAIDVISVHRYAGVPGGWSGALDGWLQQSNGKKVFIEEWGINASTNDQKSAFVSEVKDMNSVGLPSLYWQILPPAADGCSYNPAQDEGDKFGIFFDSGIDFKGPMSGASESTAAQDWTASLRSDGVKIANAKNFVDDSGPPRMCQRI